MNWSQNQRKSLENTLGIDFHDKSIMERAFVHRSSLNELKGKKIESNEKLEFLGDSVLSLITSHHLFQTYPAFHEGQYTNIKAAIVRTESLAEAAQRLRLGDYLMLSKGEDEQSGRSNISILADTFEAVIGAIYLDQGYQVARDFVHMHLLSAKVTTVVSEGSYNSFKNSLQEHFQQRYKKLPVYETMTESGPEHDKFYTIGVSFNGILLAKGSGKSKKIAEEKAAQRALTKIAKDVL